MWYLIDHVCNTWTIWVVLEFLVVPVCLMIHIFWVGVIADVVIWNPNQIVSFFANSPFCSFIARFCLSRSGIIHLVLFCVRLWYLLWLPMCRLGMQNCGGRFLMSRQLFFEMLLAYLLIHKSHLGICRFLSLLHLVCWSCSVL